MLVFLLGGWAVAQSEYGWGITAGVNYGSTGDLIANGQTIIDNPDRKIGYHAGLYWKFDLNFLYLRPELKYTKLSNEYNGVALDIQKLDFPLLIGFNVAGPIHVFGGPSLQFIMDTNFQDIELRRVKEEFTIGAQLGIGVNIGNLGVDVRYERGFRNNEVNFIQNTVDFNGLIPDRVDTRPEQIILAVSVKL